MREVTAKRGVAGWHPIGSELEDDESQEAEPKEGRMNVLALTIFVTLALVCFFLFLFVVSIVEGKGSARDALLPLENDLPDTAKEGGVEK